MQRMAFLQNGHVLCIMGTPQDWIEAARFFGVQPWRPSGVAPEFYDISSGDCSCDGVTKREEVETPQVSGVNGIEEMLESQACGKCGIEKVQGVPGLRFGRLCERAGIPGLQRELHRDCAGASGHHHGGA